MHFQWWDGNDRYIIGTFGGNCLHMPLASHQGEAAISSKMRKFSDSKLVLKWKRWKCTKDENKDWMQKNKTQATDHSCKRNNIWLQVRGFKTNKSTLITHLQCSKASVRGIMLVPQPKQAKFITKIRHSQRTYHTQLNQIGSWFLNTYITT